ncbi:MAG: nitroreductase family protein [Peptostreptococcaceae bacterium]|nr:nitroreductase family protein [Peptostreptococcaceae bacterium]
MDFFEAINSRYSYRGAFTKEKLSNDDIEKILTAGIAAPTGMHIPTTSYIAITDENLLKELSYIVPGKSVLTATFVIVMLTENKSMMSGMNFEIENYSAAAENILLAITSLGYATVWTDGTLRSPSINTGVRELLNVPSHMTIRAVLPIGRPVTPLAPQVKEQISDTVIFNKF